MCLQRLSLAAFLSLATALVFPLNPSILLPTPSNTSVPSISINQQSSRQLNWSHWPTRYNAAGNLCVSFTRFGPRLDNPALLENVTEGFKYIKSEIEVAGAPEAPVERPFHYDWVLMFFTGQRSQHYPLTFGQASNVVDTVSLLTGVYGAREIEDAKISLGGCENKFPMVGSFFLHFGVIL